jgi:tetratricopeptide (TPR) repeat protein
MTSEPSVPKIQVGGDFKFGDVSGQIAIGENITQTQIFYKDCTFILPSGSTVQGKSWLYTQGIRPTTDPNNIFGRQRELDEIDKRFKQCTALAIAGFRGAGKSTLASMYLDIIDKRGEYAGIYWRKVDETIDVGDVVGSFFTAIGKPVQDAGRYKIEDLINLLFRELNAAPYFLVLDNFEILLDPQTNKPKKPGFSDMIEKATESAGRSHVIFTSWECPASERGIRPRCYKIGGLDDPAAIQLLRRNGLTEPDNVLKKAIELAGGHPLALILLVQLVKDGVETLSSILKDNTLWKGEVAENILDKVYKERLSEEERELLQYVSLYRELIPLKAIVSAAHDPNWTEAFVKRTALGLSRKSLLQKTGENYWEESLIHSYAYNKLDDRVESHKLAYQYYLSLPVPEKRIKKEDIQSLIEAHFHACMAKEYDVAASIISDHELYEDLHRWGSYRTLVDLYVRVLPKDHFRDEPLLNDRKIHSVVLGKLGIVYRALGEIRKSIKYCENALKIAQEIGDRKNEGVWLGSAGTAYRYLSDVEKAIENYEKALKIAQEIGDRRNEGEWLGNIGRAYRDLGNAKRAKEYYEKALKIAQKIGDRRNSGIWLGNIGRAYRDLGNAKGAIEYYEKALKIAQKIGDKRNEGVWLGGLGRAYGDISDVRKAIEYYEKALKISQEIGDRRTEGTWIESLGHAYHNLGEVRKAIEFYEKALKVSQEIGDRRNESRSVGSLGHAYHALGDVRKAIKYYEKALIIAQEIGYIRNVKTIYGYLGSANRYLGDVGKAIMYYEKALKIAQEIPDIHSEGAWLNNLGNSFRDEKRYKDALACYLMAKDIRTRIEDPALRTTESDIKNLEKELGKNEFEKLTEELANREEEIVRKMLEGVTT